MNQNTSVSAVDQLNPAVVQAVRSAWQALWSALIGLGVVADLLESAGVDPDAAAALAFSLTMALFVIAARALAEVHPAFGWLLNGIHRNPNYAGA